MTAETRKVLLVTLADHIRAKLPHLGEEPPSPRGCVILLALDVLGAGVALAACAAEVLEPDGDPCELHLDADAGDAAP